MEHPLRDLKPGMIYKMNILFILCILSKSRPQRSEVAVDLFRAALRLCALARVALLPGREEWLSVWS